MDRVEMEGMEGKGKGKGRGRKREGMEEG